MENLAVSYKDEAGRLRVKRPLAELKPLRCYCFRSVREIKSYKGQPSMPGYYYMFRMGEHVAYESREEMKALMRLDFDPEVEMVCSQPLAIHYGAGYTHYPDFFVWYTTGKGRLLNVKPEVFQGKEDSKRDFEAADQVCREIGWTHAVEGEADLIFQSNLNWISGFRRRPPVFESYASQLTELCASGPQTIEHLIRECGPSYAVRPVLFHLFWLRLLEFDLWQPLTEQTLVDLPSGTLNDC